MSKPTIKKPHHLPADEVLKKIRNSRYNLDDYLEELATEKGDMIEGYPTEKYLRKLFEVFIGKIIGRHSVISTSSPDYASVSVTIKAIKDGDIVEYSGCGDCITEHVQKPYNKYPVPMAETRATSRAYRNALGIRQCSSEEIMGTKQDNSEGGQISFDPSSFNIQNAINKLAKSKKKDPEELSQQMFSKSSSLLTLQEKQKLFDKLRGNSE